METNKLAKDIWKLNTIRRDVVSEFDKFCLENKDKESYRVMWNQVNAICENIRYRISEFEHNHRIWCFFNRETWCYLQLTTLDQVYCECESRIYRKLYSDEDTKNMKLQDELDQLREELDRLRTQQDINENGITDFKSSIATKFVEYAKDLSDILVEESRKKLKRHAEEKKKG